MRNFIGGFKSGQRVFAEVISSIVNFVLLSFVYLVGVGLTSIFAKLFRKRFLELKTDKEKDTYWSNLNFTQKPIKEYYRQF